MKKIVSIIGLATTLFIGFGGSKGNAETTARAFPLTQQIMITIYKSRVSGSDHDARVLFDGMNVPLRDSFLGPGKSIESADRGLSWVCGDKGANGVQCTLMMKSTPSTRVGYSPIQVQYSAPTQEAQTLFPLLHPNTADGHFVYQNEEGTLKIEASPSQFNLIYAE